MEEQARDVKNVPNEAAETVTPIRPGVNLAQAVRRARSEGAARADVVAELRGAELARLEALEDALQPVLEQVPRHVDLFDVGIIPAERPRLFIDVIGFVEMGRDRKSYRFLQDTRHGRVTVVESEKIEAIVEAVTAYIARRLLEREKALASDMTIEQAARALIAGRQPASLQPASPANGNRPAALRAAVFGAQPATAQAQAPVEASAGFRFFVFMIEVLGAATFFALLGLALWGVWQFIGGWVHALIDRL